MKLKKIQIKKRVFLIAFLFLITFTAKAQSDLLFHWAKAIKNGVVPVTHINSIATDESGNIYATGVFSGVVDFDPGEKTVNLISGGYKDVFFAKYDADGNYVFAKSIELTETGWGAAIAVDKDDNIYVTGVFEGDADFDPSKKVAKLTSAGKFDSFLAKYDANGNYIYSKRMGGKGDDRSTAIALDGIDNIYITGNSNDAVLVKNQKNDLGEFANFDVFLAKYDYRGNFIYSKSMGGNSFDSGSGVAVSSSGDVYVTGSFELTADFDPTEDNASLVSLGNEDIFIAKYKADGSYVFAKSIGGKKRDKCNGIAVDENDSIYITGFFGGIVDYDPGKGVENLTSPEPCSLFIAKYDLNGNYTYAKSMSGGKGAIGNAIVVDKEAAVYITGIFGGTVDFDPDAALKNMTSAKSYDRRVLDQDIFIAKYDFEGHYIYAKPIGGMGNDSATSIAISDNGNIYISGDFYTPADFDPSANTYNLTTEGSVAVFVACYKESQLESKNDKDK